MESGMRWTAPVSVVVALLLAVSPYAVRAECKSEPACDCEKDSGTSRNLDEAHVTGQLRRFYEVGHELDRAYTANDAPAVKRLAAEYLELASSHRCDWNYGNAVHDANRILGLLSLKAGDLDQASDFLTRAGKSTGSPQLDSFGPDLDLANELLKRGRRDVVRQYLIDVKKFWDDDNGRVAQWVAAIDRGETPDLDPTAGISPPLWFLVAASILVALPAIAVATCFFLKRKRLKRPALYVVVGLIAGYVTLFLAWVISLLAIRLAIRVDVGLSIALFNYLPWILTTLAPPLVVTMLLKAFY